jgi:hypothetical protein
MSATLIIAAIAVGAYWLSNSQGEPITDPTQIVINVNWSVTKEWRVYEVVGTNSQGVEFVVEGLYIIEPRHPERQSDTITDSEGQPLTVWSKVWIPESVEEPQPDRWLFRASQISGGVTTPFSGQNALATGAVEGGWGVPLSDALTAAESRLGASEQGGGLGDSPTAPTTPLAPSEGDAASSDGFPNQELDSFTGFDLGATTEVETIGQASATSDLQTPRGSVI